VFFISKNGNLNEIGNGALCRDYDDWEQWKPSSTPKDSSRKETPKPPIIPSNPVIEDEDEYLQQFKYAAAAFLIVGKNNLHRISRSLICQCILKWNSINYRFTACTKSLFGSVILPTRNRLEVHAALGHTAKVRRQRLISITESRRVRSINIQTHYLYEGRDANNYRRLITQGLPL
jgi:hypothetical protein